MITNRRGKLNVSNKGHNATLNTSLIKIIPIKYLYILYKEPTVHKSRMAGFYLYVSKTTSKEDGYLCFHDNSTIHGMLSEDKRINCSVFGRYVIYYNERRPGVRYPNFYSPFAYNELCEVKVYGKICGDLCQYLKKIVYCRNIYFLKIVKLIIIISVLVFSNIF